MTESKLTNKEFATISLLLHKASDQQMIRKKLPDKYHVTPDADIFQSGKFDLLVTDESRFRQIFNRYREIQRQSEPVLLPVLLLVKDNRNIKQLNSYLEHIDDMLTIPTSMGVVQSRINLLLKTRSYSVKMQKEKRKYQLLAENSTDMISTHAPNGNYTYVSPSSEEIFGFTPDELIGKSAYNFIHPDDRESVAQTSDNVVKSGKPQKVEFRKRTKEGGYKWMESTIKIMQSSIDSDLPDIQASTRDISERKKYEQELEKENAFIDKALELWPNIFFMMDSDQNIIRWNQNLVDKLGYSSEEIKGMSPYDFIKSEDVDTVEENMEKIFQTGKSEFEVDLVARNGESIKHRVNGQKFHQGDEVYIIGSCIDLSDHYRLMNDLKRAHDEKQVLLKEIHHRVKNNLAVITGMLELQSMESENEDLRNGLNDSKLRIHSIASVHELLYQSNSFSRVVMKKYLNKLLDKIQETNYSAQNIEVDQKIEPVELNINQAIPTALITNEIITNAFKHAFKDREEGKIDIRLQENAGNVQLIIRDNGKGLSDEMAPSNSLGLKLINVLKKQLEAELEISSERGAEFRLTFTKKQTGGIGSNYMQ